MANRLIESLHKQAEELGIPLGTREQVAADLASDPKTELAMARLMVRYGRLTDDARAYAQSRVEALEKETNR